MAVLKTSVSSVVPSPLAPSVRMLTHVSRAGKSGKSDGTGAGTNHAELYSTQKRYLEGTYASRVRFTDTPVSVAYQAAGVARERRHAIADDVLHVDLGL